MDGKTLLSKWTTAESTAQSWDPSSTSTRRAAGVRCVGLDRNPVLEQRLARSLNSAPAGPPVDPDHYIVEGDQVVADSRSTLERRFQGRVLRIFGQEPGRREFVIELEGQDWLIHGAVGLPEPGFIFKVQRGDCWVLVPSRLLPEEAEKKVARSKINTRERIEAAVPLFADQISVTAPSAEQLISNWYAADVEKLTADHYRALESTALRQQVKQLVSVSEMESLDKSRSRMPADGLYGTLFWEKQLAHIKLTGHPDIFVAPPSVKQRLNIPWLAPDAEVECRLGEAIKRVRVLYIGSSEVLVKILGQPITDYDPRQYPYGNVWVKPEELALKSL